MRSIKHAVWARPRQRFDPPHPLRWLIQFRPAARIAALRDAMDGAHNSDLPSAIAASLLKLKTKLHTQDEIAQAFGCHRNFVPTLLEHMKCAEFVGTGKRARRGRLPLQEMPIDYIREVWPELTALLRTSSRETPAGVDAHLPVIRRIA
jgi:hypothetical protein